MAAETVKEDAKVQPLVIFYDSEAANGNVYRGDIIEIAAKCHPDVVKGSFQSLINTKQPLCTFGKWGATFALRHKLSVKIYAVSKFVTFMTPLVFFKEGSLVLLRTLFSQYCIKQEKASYKFNGKLIMFLMRRRTTSYARNHERWVLCFTLCCAIKYGCLTKSECYQKVIRLLKIRKQFLSRKFFSWRLSQIEPAFASLCGLLILVFPACAFGHKLRYVFMSKRPFCLWEL